MSKTLPKGHASCLAPGFKYTPSAHTDLAKTRVPVISAQWPFT